MEKEKIEKVISEAVEEVQNENYKIVLKLKLEGWKLEEIAEIIGKTREAVKNDYKRGKKSLKEILKRKGYILK